MRTSHLKKNPQVVKRNIYLTPLQVAADIETATGANVSARNISRRVNEIGFYAWKINSMPTA